MSEFGVIVICCERDVHLARGCVASVRYFLGDVPLCLVVDGEVDVEDIVRTYGAAVIRRDDVADPELRAHCFGWGRAKMICHWEAPWETYLMLDADTIIWGDISRHARFDNFDMITDRHIRDAFPEALASIPVAVLLGGDALEQTRRKYHHAQKWYFDVPGLTGAAPGTDWEHAVDRLFCPGALLARRGVLSRERFSEFVAMGHARPGLFSRGEMGLLNALVIEAGIKVDQRSDFHQLVHIAPRAELERRFPVDPDTGPKTAREATAIHWAGVFKPTLCGSLAYSEPMNFFRRRFLADSGVAGRRVIDGILAREDEIYADLMALGISSDRPAIVAT